MIRSAALSVPGSRGPIDVLEDPHRQPRRDRLPGHPHRPPARDQDRRRVLGGRRARAARPRRRRGLPHRPGRGKGKLPSRRSHPRGRAHRRRAGDPSRLRLPLGERGLRRGLRARGRRVHRPAGVRDPRDGLEERGEAHHGAGGRTARRRLPRRRAGSGVPAARSRSHRLPGAHQGLRRRRRQGHAHRRGRGRLRRRARLVQARGDVRLRRRPRPRREVPPPAAPHRDPGLRRPPRQLRASLRARLLGPAAPPEGPRGSAGARHDAGAPRRDGRRRGGGGEGDRLRRRRHRRVHRRDLRRARSTSWR